MRRAWLVPVVLMALAAPVGAQPAPSSFTNPVWSMDFADPSVLLVDGRYHAYRTSGERMPSIVSDDLVTWRDAGDALPELPAWSEPGFLWAPAVLPRGDGYVLYYTTRETATGLQCLSRARGHRPEGPFVDTSSGPMICQRDRNGSIDPDPFVDADGTPHLLFKSEGGPGSDPSIIWVIQLSADGYDPVGGPFPLLREDQPWEAPRIEAPSMVLVDGRYHLFYSGNRWDTAGYGVGHAICATVRGPCAKTSDRPLLSARGGVAGPGGQDVFADAEGAWWIAYHGWNAATVGYPQGQRQLRLEPLAFVGDRPVLDGPSEGPVPLVRAMRVAGPDRYGTAAALSRARFAPGVPVATVTTGTDFPDALAGAPAAKAGGGPVLLVTHDEVPEVTAAELARLQPAAVRVLGGPAAVSDAVIERLRAIAGVTVSRVAGEDRAGTAAAASQAAFPAGAAVALIASGEVAPDAVVAGAAGAHLGGPVLLAAAETVTAVTLDGLRRLAPARVLVVGGGERISMTVEDALRAALPEAIVERIEGPDRYATSAAVARALFPEPLDEVVAATGERFPDALAAGSLGKPVLLVGGGVGEAVRAEVARLAAQRILVLGGRAAVDDVSFADLDLYP